MATKVAVATMKMEQIPKAGADFEIVVREIPQPGVGHVRIKVQACGVCHSDVFTKEGWAAGTPADSEDTLRFAELTGVRPMIRTYPLEKAAEAYARMMSGNAHFHVVLTM